MGFHLEEIGAAGLAAAFQGVHMFLKGGSSLLGHLILVMAFPGSNTELDRIER